MMNAELVSAGEERIIIPTVFRGNYLTALKALSLNGLAQPIVRTLDFAQRWVTAIQWRDLDGTRHKLECCNALMDSNDADERGLRLRLPDRLS